MSIARALMNGGDVILADEPTGALDKKSGQEMMAILRELHTQGHTVILVTHDQQVALNAQRVIEISDGVIIRDEILSESQGVTGQTPIPLLTSPLKGEGRSGENVGGLRGGAAVVGAAVIAGAVLGVYGNPVLSQPVPGRVGALCGGLQDGTDRHGLAPDAHPAHHARHYLRHHVRGPSASDPTLIPIPTPTLPLKGRAKLHSPRKVEA